MKHLVIWLLIVGFSFILGCSGDQVKVDLRDFPHPIMVSPVMRIGDTGPPERELKALAAFKGKNTKAFSSSYSETYTPDYRYKITTHTVTQSWKRGIGAEIWKATGGRSNRVVVVDEIQAGHWLHCSILGFVYDWITVKGRAVNTSSLQKRRK